MNRNLLTAALIAFLALPAAPAAASPLTLFGYNPRGMAMGSAQTAAADDGSAAFYNPALLTTPLQVTFGFGAQYIGTNLYIDPRGTSFSSEDQPVFPGDFVQYNLQVVFPMGGKVRNRISLGIALSLPHGYLGRVESIDPMQPSFPIYQASARKVSILPAFGIKVTDWLAIGGGLQVLAGLTGTSAVTIDMFSRRVTHRELSIDLVTREAPTAGVVFGPFQGLTVGLAFRHELGLDYEVPAYVEIEDIGVLDLRLTGVSQWTPHEIALGAAWDVPGLDTVFSFDLVYGVWSRAPSPQVMVVLDTGGELIEGLGFGEAMDLCSERETVDSTGRRACVAVSPGYVDNLVPRIGVEHRAGDVFVIRGGWWYWPTPVPNQVGRTNYLDASAHHISAGVGIAFRDPLDVFEQPVTLDVGVEGVFMLERAVDKGSDQTVEYAFGGSMFQLAAAVRYRF